MEVSKKDWKLFRACIGEWQEAYMERLTKEYIDLLTYLRVLYTHESSSIDVGVHRR